MHPRSDPFEDQRQVALARCHPHLCTATTEFLLARRAPGAATRWAAVPVFVALGAIPWGPAWRALWPQPGLANTVAWWVAVIAFSVAAALLRNQWPRAGALVVASTLAVGAWQGYGFRGGCAGNDPLYSGIGFALGAMVWSENE